MTADDDVLLAGHASAVKALGPDGDAVIRHIDGGWALHMFVGRGDAMRSRLLCADDLRADPDGVVTDAIRAMRMVKEPVA